MRELVPIRFTVFKRKTAHNKGTFDWPNWAKLPKRFKVFKEWVDSDGIGWRYDNVSPHGSVDEYSPDPKVVYAATAVPAEMADALVKTFPNQVEFLSPEQWEQFHDERHLGPVPELQLHYETIAALKMAEDLYAGAPPPGFSDLKDKVLDPDDPHPGVSRTKKWKQISKKFGVKIIPPKSD